MKLLITISLILPLSLAASIGSQGTGNEQTVATQPKPALFAQPFDASKLKMVPPEMMRALIAKVAQRVVLGKTVQKRSELAKPDSLTNEDIQKYFLATEEALKSKRHIDEKKSGLSPEEFQQYLSAAVQFQPSNKYQYFAPQTAQPAQPVLPAKVPVNGAKVKRGGAAQRSGYGGYQPASAEYHSYDQGFDHHHEPHYPTKVLHYDEEDARTRNAVFDALWRAFQAITGGVMIIGGHIAKGSGYLLQAKGRLLQETGPAVAEFGRSVASESLNRPPVHPPIHHYKAKPHVYRHVHHYVSKPVYAPRKPYYKSYGPVASYSHHHPEIAEYAPAIEAAIDTHSAFKVAAAGTSRAIGDLVHELSNTAARAYLIKE